MNNPNPEGLPSLPTAVQEAAIQKAYAFTEPGKANLVTVETMKEMLCTFYPLLDYIVQLEKLNAHTDALGAALENIQQLAAIDRSCPRFEHILGEDAQEIRRIARAALEAWKAGR